MEADFTFQTCVRVINKKNMQFFFNTFIILKIYNYDCLVIINLSVILIILLILLIFLKYENVTRLKPNFHFNYLKLFSICRIIKTELK